MGELVRGALPALHGDEGRVLAWTLGDPQRDCASSSSTVPSSPSRNRSFPSRSGDPSGRRPPSPLLKWTVVSCAAPVVRLVEECLVLLGDRAAPFLEKADALAREYLTPSQLQTSRVLPLAFADRCRTPGRQGRIRVHGDGRRHRVALLAPAAGLHGPDLAVLEAMGRLSRYLDQPSILCPEVVEQVRQYQLHGAFADVATAHLRRALSGCARHHAEAGKPGEGSSASRPREPPLCRDPGGRLRGRAPSRGVDALHRIWRRIVAPAWQQDPKARLFLVVLDGCSYPVFLELLLALAQGPGTPGLAGGPAPHRPLGAQGRRHEGPGDGQDSLTFLGGLLQLLRQSGYSGLVVVLDEVETIQRMNAQPREKSLNALRQFMDTLANDDLPGMYMVVTGTRDFYEGSRG